MQIVADLMKRPSTEILVNFMFEEINRFLNHPHQEKNFDSLFACTDWRRGYQLTGAARKKFIHDLYRDQLHKSAKARYVRSFEMRNQRDVSDYFLYFVSNNLLGSTKMKEAMWKVDPGGGVSFTDATNFDQTVLVQPEFDRRHLRGSLPIASPRGAPDWATLRNSDRRIRRLTRAITNACLPRWKGPEPSFR